MSGGPPSSPAQGDPERGRTSAWRRIRDFLLRGGRLTKVAGETASYAPSVGRAAPAALGAFADLVARASSAGRAAASVSTLGILAGTFMALSAPEALAHREYRFGTPSCHNHPDSNGSNHVDFWCIGPVNTPQAVRVSNRAVNLILGQNANQTNIQNDFYIYDGSKRALEIEQSGPGGITVTRGPAQRVSMTSHGTVLRAVNRGAGNITISLSNATLRKNTDQDDSVVRIVNEDAAGGSVTLNLGTISIGTGNDGLGSGPLKDTHGDGHALYITNNGSGATAISASGHIVGVGANGDGIRVRGSGSVTAEASLSITAATVTGGGAGIDVEHRGGGDVSIRAGAVTAGGLGDTAIEVRNFTGDSAVTINAAAIVSKGTRHSGYQGANAAHGIEVYQAAGGGVAINVSGAVSAAGRSGIYVNSKGSGATEITVSGQITSSNGDGIWVRDDSARSAATASLTISVATVTGGWVGMRLNHRGGGDVSIRATGTVTGRGGGDDGISLRNFTGDSAVTISAASVVAQGTHDGADAIVVEQKAGGGVAVTVTGAVSAAGGRGIFVDNDGDGDVTISADGSGASVSRSGSHKKDAILVENAGSGTVDVSVRSVSAGSGYDAIAVDSEGQGDVTVTIRGTVTSGTGAARAVRIETPSGVAGKITLKSGAVVRGVIEDAGANTELIVESGARLERNVFLGGGDDTFVLHRRGDFTGNQVSLGAGTDTLRIEFPIGGHPADFTGGFSSGWEILHLGSGGHFRDKPWFITRSNYPINVFHRFSFDVDVRRLEGMKMTQTGSGGITLIQSGGFMRAAQYPIAALNSGEGDVSITLAGEVKSHDQKGGDDYNPTLAIDNRGKRWHNKNQGLVHAENKDASGGSVWITVGSVQASTVSGQYRRFAYVWPETKARTYNYAGGGLTHAVWAKNLGTGATTVIAKGKLRGGSLRGDGAKVETGSLTTSVDVSVGDVETRNTGISISHGGTGNVSVTASGTINARNHNIKESNTTVSVRGGDGPGILVSASNAESSGNVKVDAATITADAEGIVVRSSFRGDISVSATGRISAKGGHGIEIDKKGSGTGSISVNAAAIAASVDGIVVRSSSTDNISISATSAVAASGGHGIFIEEKGSGTNSVSVNALGSVSGEKSGIKASGKIGSITISAATVTGTEEHGINVKGEGDISITATGTVAGKKTAILVTSTGSETGEVSVHVDGSFKISSAVKVDTRNSPITLTIGGETSFRHENLIYGDEDTYRIISLNQSGTGGITITQAENGREITGIYEPVTAINRNQGDVLITLTGPVRNIERNTQWTYSGRLGIVKAENLDSSGGSISVTVGSVLGRNTHSGPTHGIQVFNRGSGTTTVIATGNVRSGTKTKDTSGPSGHGIRVEHHGRGDVSVSVAGSLESRNNNALELVLPDKSRSANVNVNLATVTAREGRGIYVSKKGKGSGGVSITTSGSIDSKKSAILVKSSGTGKVSVHAGGKSRISSNVKIDTTDAPIVLTIGSEVSLRQTNFNGNDEDTWRQIYLTQSGTGGITITQAKNGREISGFYRPVTAINRNQGDVSITLTGPVSNYYKLLAWSYQNNSGIVKAYNRDSSGGSISVTVGSVLGRNYHSGPNTGIQAINKGSGTTTVVATGNVRSGTRYRGKGRSGHGIRVEHHGRGDVSVSVAGYLRSRYNNALELILPNTSKPAANINVNLSTVTGGDHGVHVVQSDHSHSSFTVSGSLTATRGHGFLIENSGSGSISVNALGEVRAANDAISIKRTGSPTAPSSITVSVKDVDSSSGHGIHVKVPSGAVSVLSVGSVTGRGGGDSGVFVETLDGSGTGAVRVDLADVAAEGSGTSSHGVHVMHSGHGDVSIVVSGTARSLGGDAIHASATGSPSSVAGSPSSITVGVNDAESSSGHGVRVEGSSTSMILVSASGRVVGGVSGIRVSHLGSGSVSVVSSGTVLGRGRDAGAVWVSVSSSTDSDAVTLNLASVTAEGSGSSAHGIFVDTASAGGVSVSAGTVNSVGGHGIFVDARGGATAFVTAGRVASSSGHGIRVLGSGAGGGAWATATANVSATAAGKDGISIETGAGGSSATVSVGSAATVAGGRSGVRLSHAGGGSVSVLSFGTVVSRAEHAIHVLSSGSGGISVSAPGDLRPARDGVRIDRGAAAGTASSISVDVWRVFAPGGHGVRVHGPSGDVSVTVRGGVVSGRAGISLDAGGSSRSATVTLESGALVGSAAGTAISASGGTTSVVAKSGGTVRGTVSLGSGADTLLVSGGRVDGTVRFGGGSDAMRLSSGSAGGRLDFGAGSDSLVWTGGILSGEVDFGSGLDRFDFRPALASERLDILNLGSLRIEAGRVEAALSLSNPGSASVTLSSATLVRARRGAALALSGTDVWLAQEPGGPPVSGPDGAVGATGTGPGDLSVSLAGGAEAPRGTAVLVERRSGSGATAVSVAGPVSAGGAGVSVRSPGAGGSLDLSVSGVSGGSFGIDVRHGGAVSLSVSGPVTGGSGAADAALSVSGSPSSVRVSVLGGGSLGSPGRWAILASSGPLRAEVGGGASVTGGVRASGASDSLTFGSGASGALETVSGIETLVVESGARVSVSDVVSGLDALAVRGSLDLADGTVRDTEVGSGGLSGGGVVSLDVDFYAGAGDTLKVAGDVTGVTMIDVSTVGRLVGGAEVAVFEGVAGGTASRANFAVDADRYIMRWDAAARRLTLSLPVGGCRETPAGSGVFTCSGPVIVETQEMRASGSTAIFAVLHGETAVVSSGTAFVLSQTGSAGITFTQSSGGRDILSESGGGVVARSAGGGVAVSLAGSVTASAGAGILASGPAAEGSRCRRRGFRGRRAGSWCRAAGRGRSPWPQAGPCPAEPGRASLSRRPGGPSPSRRGRLPEGSAPSP